MNTKDRWWAPWGKCLHLSMSGAMLWQKSWYEQQQLLVLFEFGAAKLDMKEAQADYDVHKIEIEKVQMVLRKGKGTSKHWRCYDQLTENIKEDLMNMQYCRHRITKFRDHLLFLKWRITEAEEEYEEALKEEQETIESSSSSMTLLEEDESASISTDGQCVWMELDDLH